MPAPGQFVLHLWLRDEAGNDAPSSALDVPLRFDDVPPGLAFAVGGDGDGEGSRSRSAPPSATPTPAPPPGRSPTGASTRRPGRELPTKLQPEPEAGQGDLVARTPDLAPGTYVFRADAGDAAGNAASTTLRADGTEMAIRKIAAARWRRSRRCRSRRHGGRRGCSRGCATARALAAALTVPFAAPALLSGRLTRADGAGIAGRELRVVARPSRGALAPAATATRRHRRARRLRAAPRPRTLATDRASPSPATPALSRASRPSLDLRVRSGISLRSGAALAEHRPAVRLSGRVRSRGAPIPRRGKLVAIQYLEAATRRWRPVLVTRSDHGGRFRARYRFRYVAGVASIRLRATALAEERWPYAPGSSRPVTVRVSGR